MENFLEYLVDKTSQGISFTIRPKINTNKPDWEDTGDLQVLIEVMDPKYPHKKFGRFIDISSEMLISNIPAIEAGIKEGIEKLNETYWDHKNINDGN